MLFFFPYADNSNGLNFIQGADYRGLIMCNAGDSGLEHAVNGNTAAFGVIWPCFSSFNSIERQAMSFI